MSQKLVRIQQKKDSTADWNNSNLFLFDGEIGIDQTTGQIKIGKKISDEEFAAWSDLSYITSASENAYKENCFSFGQDSVAGQKGYYIGAIDTFNKWIYLIKGIEKPSSIPMGSNKVPENGTLLPLNNTSFSVGDEFSIINDSYYYFCGKIEQIDITNNRIKYNVDLPFTTISYSADFDDQVFFVTNKPYEGDINLIDNAMAIGQTAKANGKGSFACGRETMAAGGGAFAAGRKTKAGYIGTASGLSTSATGDCAFTANSYTTARGNSSAAFGAGTTASGLASFSCGSNTTAEGTGTFAAGVNTSATVDASTVFGKGTNTTGVASLACGNETTAGGIGALSSGSNTFATGNFSFATNNYTNANGEASAAFGFNTQANGTNSFVTGMSTVANGEMMIVGGKFNATLDNKIIVYGKGEDNANRSDAYTLDWNGNAYYAGTIETLGIKLPTYNITLSYSNNINSFVDSNDTTYYYYDLTTTSLNEDFLNSNDYNLIINLKSLDITSATSIDNYIEMKNQYEYAELIGATYNNKNIILISGDKPTQDINIEVTVIKK